MVHVLLIIFTNGAEASLDGGRRSPEVRLSAMVGRGAPRLTIEDNGPGVRRADAEAIFRPFFTTKPAGSGVGLSFARQVALSHGGGLTLSPPEPGRGAVFVVTL